MRGCRKAEASASRAHARSEPSSKTAGRLMLFRRFPLQLGPSFTPLVEVRGPPDTGRKKTGVSTLPGKKTCSVNAAPRTHRTSPTWACWSSSLPGVLPAAEFAKPHYFYPAMGPAVFFFQRVTLTRKACRTLTVPYLAPTMPEGVSLKHCQTQLHQA